MQKSPALVLPHLHSVAAIAGLVGFDLETGQAAKNFGAITGGSLDRASVIAKQLPTLKLSPVHLTEVTGKIGQIVDYVHKAKTDSTATKVEFLELLQKASDQLKFNNKQAQNGVGTSAEQTAGAQHKPAGTAASAR